MSQPRRRLSGYVLLSQSAPIIGFVASMVVLVIIVVLMRESPLKAVDAVYKFSLSNAAKLAAVLSISIPYYLSGLSIAIAFRAGVFNIGNEGQYFVGGMTGALAGIYLPLPAPLHLPVVVLAAMLGGAFWAFVPAVLKAVRGINEVITTIMFNNIGLALVNYLINGPLSGMAKGVSLEPQTKKILPTALFGKLNGFFRSVGWKVPDYVYLDYSLVVAVVMGLVIWFLLFRTRQGFEIRAVGTSVDVSRYAGIKVQRVQIGAFLMSGAIAGLMENVVQDSGRDLVLLLKPRRHGARCGGDVVAGGQVRTLDRPDHCRRWIIDFTQQVFAVESQARVPLARRPCRYAKDGLGMRHEPVGRLCQREPQQLRRRFA